MPMYFQYTFGRKVTLIIDYFECLSTTNESVSQSPNVLLIQTSNTINVLIAITPQGTVSFVSLVRLNWRGL